MKSASGKAFDLVLLSRIFTYTRPYRKLLWATIMLTLALAALGPLRPWLTQIALDDHILNGNYRGLVEVTILMLMVAVVQSMIQFFQNHQSSLLGQNVIHDMRSGLFSRIIRFRTSWFDRTAVGIPVTRTVSDMETIADVFSDGVIIIIGDLLQLTVIIAYMFYIDWQLTLVALSTIPLLIIATNIFKNAIKGAFNEVRTHVASLNIFVQEHLSGMKVVQMFNREQEEMEKFKKINRKHRDAHIRSVWYYSIFFPVVEILSAISIGLVVWWGAGEVLTGHTSFGMVVAFIMYINLLFRPIRELADKFNTLQMGMVSSERIFNMMDLDEEESATGTKISDIKGKIEFRKVWFAYEPGQWVVKDLSFIIQPGETLAIVGSTGAGKTTIINLINRLYDIQKGQILIDDIDITEYKKESLRSRIAVVLQDVFLFSETLEYNIRLGNNDINQSRMEQGAEAIGVKDYISQLPDQFQYRVGERGGMLSMGQRQLIAFVRAYVQNPGILILDEATSSIDSETEEMIIKATAKLTRGRTSLIIAHRLATVQHADRIMVMDEGRLAEIGKHEELLELKGKYYNLYRIQFAPDKN
jgi:ATP-binding cassette, subfamily B, multidrug efflux pump